MFENTLFSILISPNFFLWAEGGSSGAGGGLPTESLKLTPSTQPHLLSELPLTFRPKQSRKQSIDIFNELNQHKVQTLLYNV